MICESCKQKILDFYDFKKQCEKTNDILKMIYSRKGSIFSDIDDDTSDSLLLQDFSDETSKNEQNKCSTCSKSYETALKLRR